MKATLLEVRISDLRPERRTPGKDRKGETRYFLRYLREAGSDGGSALVGAGGGAGRATGTGRAGLLDFYQA